MAASQLSPISQFTQQSLYSPNNVDVPITYRDYAAAAAAAYASNQPASYLSPAHSKNSMSHNANQTNNNNAIFGSGSNSILSSAIGSLNLPAPPPAHHQSLSTSAHHSSLANGSIAVNPNNSHSTYSYHGLVQSANLLPAHIQQASSHSHSQLHSGSANSNVSSGAAALSAIHFPQSNYSASYVSAIQPLAGPGSSKSSQYSNLYQLFAE